MSVTVASTCPWKVCSMQPCMCTSSLWQVMSSSYWSKAELLLLRTESNEKLCWTATCALLSVHCHQESRVVASYLSCPWCQVQNSILCCTWCLMCLRSCKLKNSWICIISIQFDSYIDYISWDMLRWSESLWSLIEVLLVHAWCESYW